MKYLRLFRKTFQEFSEDKATRLAAALAYYTIFSVAPLLVIAIAIAGLFFGEAQAQHAIVSQLKNFMGDSGVAAIQQMLQNQHEHGGSSIALIAGFVILLFGATGVFVQLKDALNTAWNVPEGKTAGGIKGFIKTRLLAFGMVLGIGFLLLVSLAIDAAISSLGAVAFADLPGGAGIWQGMQLIVSFVVIALLFAAMFRLLPDTHVEWRDVWFGAFFTSLLFIIGKYLLGLYLGRGSVGSSFGAAGSLVVLLVWIYWSAAIFLFGAEFTQVYARAHGSRVGEEQQLKSAA
ncbi:MAG TPA: YihY/virulence factor BrkB family protein [Thermoanaerobaculia bacterium]|nr:YihY/virulence factor BrkB family protein [Thermoanaerobaculia bacterium]